MVIDDLFSLVKSLSTSEAAYFSEHLPKRKIKDCEFYLSLFKEIRQQETYNEKLIIRQLTKEQKPKSFSITKHRLGEYILDALVAFHANTSITCKVHRLTEITWLLYYKRFYAQAMKVLDQAKDEAHKFEKHYLLLEISEIERKLMKEMPSADLLQKLNNNITDKAELFGKIQNEDTLAAINDRVFLLYREISTVKDKFNQAELDKLMSHSLLQNIDNALSFESKLKYHYAHAVYNRLSGNYKQALHHREEVDKLWNQNPHRINEMPIRYREDLCSLLSDRHRNQDYKGFEQLIKQIENQKAYSTPEEDASVFRQIYYLRQIYMLNNGKRKEALALIPVIEKGLEQHKEFIGQSSMLNFWYNIAATFFLNGKYKEALEWVKKLLAIERTSKVRKDLRDFAQIFEIVLYLELGEHHLVEYRIRNTRDRLKNNDRLFEFEDIVLSSFKRLLSVTNEKDKSLKIYKNLLEELNRLGEKPGMESLLGLEEISIWLREKIS